MTIGKEKTMTDETTKTQLPLTLELAEPKLIAGEVDIQLCCGTSSTNESNTIDVISLIVIDASVDVQVDDNDF